MEHSQELNELFAALSKFRVAVKQPSKDSSNPFFKNKYVSLEGTIKAIDEGIEESKCGLSFVQLVYDDEKGAKIVETILAHSSGQWLSSGKFSLIPAKKDPQGWGSAITYEKRYQLSALLGIASDLDDDANSCGQATNQSNNYQRHPASNTNPLKRDQAIYQELVKKIAINMKTTEAVVNQTLRKHALNQHADFENQQLIDQYKILIELAKEQAH